ncbi:precorrin-2 dehydrogenase/sirohydrochlorin ferrochelatase family protein [Desulfonispora thiosulfatigenes]|uniref:precorrin-2 dehydrogenase/sirohydrochlorin ferrochelatase family protein n=1 Tax=Desulfonispora thiosulfatigenes TaxID=83661 RepID=UPI0013564D95|nr:bifunctional precorrin-2 dehydrogenase/sirohydrochlorin ferrochelatase [Desulfonispora thiosulfatigenes]
MKNKKCVVVGGGNVAERKVKSLLACSANIYVISPQITKNIEDLSLYKKISWLKEEFAPNLIHDSFLVIAATNNRIINEEISKYCEKNNILVNVIDSMENSNFIVNATMKQNDLVISVSTSGKSPALARKIKEELKLKYGKEYGILLEILGETRELVKANISDENLRKEFFTKVIDTEILDLIKQEKVIEAKRRVKSWLLSH